MKKNDLMVAAFAMTLGAATFTSCTSEDDFLDSSAVVNNQLSENQGNDGLYSNLNSGNGEDFSVKIEGSKATVSRSAVANGEPNAEVVFDKSWKGRLVMKDNSLGVSEVPFVKSASMLQLNFSNTDVMNGNSVILKKTDIAALSRGSSDEDNGNSYITEDGQQLLSALAQGLLKFGTHTTFDDFGDAMADPLLGLIFGGSEKNKSEFNEIEDQIESINTRLDKIVDKYQMTDLKGVQSNHWTEISNLKYVVDEYITILNNNPGDKKAILFEFANTTTNGTKTSGNVTSLLNKYGGKDGTNRFKQIDNYFIRTNTFLEQSYAYRDLYRIEDMKVLTQAYILTMQYFKERDIAKKGEFIYDDLISAYELYVDAMKKNLVTGKITDKAICTIPGALLIMDKTILSKVFGNNPHFGHMEYGKNVIKDSGGSGFFDRDGAWIYSYMYSDFPLEDRKTEIKDKCLTRAEANAITWYYGGNRGLTKILVEDGGMERSDTSNSTMLLGNFANANWTQYDTARHKEAFANLSTSLWDYKTNSYNDPVIQTMKFDAHCVASWRTTIFISWYCFNGSAPYSADYTQKERTFSSADEMLEYIHEVEAKKSIEVNAATEATAKATIFKNACDEAASLIKAIDKDDILSDRLTSLSDRLTSLSKDYTRNSVIVTMNEIKQTLEFVKLKYPDVYNEITAKYNLYD